MVGQPEDRSTSLKRNKGPRSRPMVHRSTSNWTQICLKKKKCGNSQMFGLEYAQRIAFERWKSVSLLFPFLLQTVLGTKNWVFRGNKEKALLAPFFGNSYSHAEKQRNSVLLQTQNRHVGYPLFVTQGIPRISSVKRRKQESTSDRKRRENRN